MNSKKTILITVLLGIVAIITGFVVMFVNDLKKDQNEMNERAKLVISEYQNFEKDVDDINKERDQIHKEFLDKIYYENFDKNDTGYKNKILKYEEDITSVSKKYKKMKEYCNSGIYYSSSDANNKCSAFNLAYEEMINSFVDDVSKYNSNIDNYNKWLESKGDTTSIKLKKYETKKTYIDFNNDGDYSGKEDNNEK